MPPPLPPGFVLVDDEDPAEILRREGFTFNNGYRTPADTAAIRAQGYTPAANGAHPRGDGLDVDHPMLSPAAQTRRLHELFGDWDGAQIIDEGHHRHLGLPGWGAAPGTPGTPNAGMPDLPPGFDLVQRGSLTGGNWMPPETPPPPAQAGPTAVQVVAGLQQTAKAVPSPAPAPAKGLPSGRIGPDEEITFGDVARPPADPWLDDWRKRSADAAATFNAAMVYTQAGRYAYGVKELYDLSKELLGRDPGEGWRKQIRTWVAERDAGRPTSFRPGPVDPSLSPNREPDVPKGRDAQAPAYTFNPAAAVLAPGLEAARFLTSESGDAAVRGAADVPLAGGADEYAALMQSIFSEKPYSELLYEQQGIDDYDAEHHPYARFGGQVAGALALPSGVGRAGFNAGREALRGGLGRAEALVAAREAGTRRLALEGGLYGGAYGFGSGRGDLGARVQNAIVEAPLGAAIGYGGGKVFGPMLTRTGPPRTAPRLPSEADAGPVNDNYRLTLADLATIARRDKELRESLPANDDAPRATDQEVFEATYKWLRDQQGFNPDQLAAYASSRGLDADGRFVGTVQPQPIPVAALNAPGSNLRRIRDRIDVNSVPPPPPGFVVVEPEIGRVRPLGAQPTADELAEAARGVMPEDVVPIPRNYVESAEEAAAMPSPRPLLEAPDEFAELGVRRIPSRNDLFRYTSKRGPLDVSQRLRTLGGIKDDNGVLAHTGLSNSPRQYELTRNEQFLGRLIDNEQGMSLDDAAFKLWEEGWFPNLPERATPADLLDVLRAELHGQRTFHPDSADELARFEAARAERGRIEEAQQAGAPLVDDLGQPATLDDLRATDPPATAYEDLPTMGGKVANINLARIETRGDVRRALQNVEMRFGGFDAARRGKITQAETSALADELGMTAADLLKRRRGQALNAEQALQARRILAQSADELTSLASRVRGGSEQEIAAFHRAVLRHAAIQEQVTGATAEAGRALSQFKMVARSRDAHVRALSGIIEGAGGRGKIEDVADMILDLQRDPAALNRFALASTKPKLKDKLTELWINSLLSGPQTHAVNFVSNLITQAGQIPENVVAAGIGAVRRGGQRAARAATGGRWSPGQRDAMLFSEVGARALGMLSGVKRGLIEGARAFKTEMPSDMMSKAEQLQQRAIGGKLGKALRTPTRAMMASDEIFKGMARRSAMDGLAIRQAYKEGLRGDALKQRAAELAANPPEEIVSEAFDFARYVTFQRPVGAVGSGIMRAKQELPILTVIAPFVRTPTNLVKYAAERSPLAPMLKTWRADMKAGGARRDTAMARVIVGSGIGAMVAQWASEGKISGGGPADQNAKRIMIADGWQPYSIKIGGKWVSYQRLDPYATTIGMAADLATKMDKMTPSQQENAAATVVTSILQQLESKTWISGIVDLVKAIENPQRSGQAFVDRTAGSIAVPAFASQIARTVDPVQRDRMDVPGVPSWLDSPVSRIMSRIPGLSDNLPAKRDIWGEEMTGEGGAGPDILSPLWVKTPKNDPTTAELLRLNSKIGEIDRTVSGRRLSDAEFQSYRERAGRYTREDLQGAMADPEWPTLDDDERRKWVESIKRDARKAAREELGLGSAPPPPGFELVQ